jgi:hypothetical protein
MSNEHKWEWTQLTTETGTGCFIALLVVVSPVPAHAQQVSTPRSGPPGNWRLIGTTEAGFLADHDGFASFLFVVFKYCKAVTCIF